MTKRVVVANCVVNVVSLRLVVKENELTSQASAHQPHGRHRHSRPPNTSVLYHSNQRACRSRAHAAYVRHSHSAAPIPHSQGWAVEFSQLISLSLSVLELLHQMTNAKEQEKNTVVSLMRLM